MKIFGIIAEFNPLHNGHKYLIDECKNKYNPDVIVGVISSSFVQRGEPGILSKWKRTELALKNGINLVVELPFVFACQNAEVFSKGAVNILNELGINSLTFGVEDDNVETLKKIAKETLSLKENVEKILKDELNKGNSFIRSKNKALLDSGILNEEEIEVLNKPNNILAIEYIKGILNLNKDIDIFPIKRKGVQHDSHEIMDEISSGTNIRNIFSKGENISSLVPKTTLDAFLEENQINDEVLYGIIKFDLQNSTKSIENSIDYEIGIENRIIKNLDISNNLKELALNSSSKRITNARIRRTIINSLLRVNKSDIFSALNNSTYVRILGFDKVGSSYLSSLNINKITNFKEYKNFDENIKNIAEIEIKATNLYSILRNESFNLDFTTSPIILK